MLNQFFSSKMTVQLITVTYKLKKKNRKIIYITMTLLSFIYLDILLYYNNILFIFWTHYIHRLYSPNNHKERVNPQITIFFFGWPAGF